MANRGQNLVLITGNMGDDPEYRAFQENGGVATISVATSQVWKDKTSGEQKSKTAWHRIQLFGHCANYARDYAQKGSLVQIRAELEYREWESDGKKHYSTDIVVKPLSGGEFQILANGKKSEQQNSTPSQNQQQKAPEPPMDFDDDIPF